MADTSDSVTIETTDDAEAVLGAYFRGRLKNNMGDPEKGDILEHRRSLAVSGTVILYTGDRYKDGCEWRRSS